MHDVVSDLTFLDPGETITVLHLHGSYISSHLQDHDSECQASLKCSDVFPTHRIADNVTVHTKRLAIDDEVDARCLRPRLAGQFLGRICA